MASIILVILYRADVRLSVHFFPIRLLDAIKKRCDRPLPDHYRLWLTQSAAIFEIFWALFVTMEVIIHLF